MSDLQLVQSPDLAVAWGRALAAVASRGVDEVTPLVVNVAGFEGGFPSEHPGVRARLDAALKAAVTTKDTVCSADTTANLIFPESLWLRYRASGRDAFFDKYRLKLALEYGETKMRNLVAATSVVTEMTNYCRTTIRC